MWFFSIRLMWCCWIVDTFVAVSIVPLHCPIVPCAVTLWYSVSGYSSPNCSQSVALYFTCIIHFVEKARGNTERSRNLIIEGFSLRFLWGKPWKLGWKKRKESSISICQIIVFSPYHLLQPLLLLFLRRYSTSIPWSHYWRILKVYQRINLKETVLKSVQFLKGNLPLLQILLSVWK